MAKVGYEDKISLYSERKEKISTKSLSIKYNICENIINYIVSLIDKHGIDILRTKIKNIQNTKKKKQSIEF